MIDQDQQQLGVIPINEAMKLARQAGLDLVEVSPTESPPVCRIMDYGKFKYERKKRQKLGAGGHVIVLKEIRLRPKTDANDRFIKLNRAKRFLGEGNKVQFTMLFRGRERVHRELAVQKFEDILGELGETVKVERRPMMEGRRMTMVVAPTKQAVPSPRAPAAAAPAKKPVQSPVAPAVVASPEQTVSSPETPAENPAEAPVESPAENPAAAPVESPAEKPAESPAG